MIRDREWLIVDTETNGLRLPIYTVEIAAQRMIGWAPAGEPFRVLLNPEVPIDPGAQAVHGYSREFLREHGEEPVRAHRAFRDYAGDLPMVAYNLSFDWNRVLVPEYRRLGVPPAGSKGFCAMTLARRAIPEAVNYRLETLKNHFNLSAGLSHRALNDVVSVVNLFTSVFRERLETAGIAGFEEVARFSRKTPVRTCLELIRQTFPDLPVVERPTRTQRARAAWAGGGSSYEYGARVSGAKVYTGQLIRQCRRILEDARPDGNRIDVLRVWLQECPCVNLYPMCAVAAQLKWMDEGGEESVRAMAVFLDTLREAVSAQDE